MSERQDGSMTRSEFVRFVQATFNAMDMITPVEGATAVIKAFDELRACADALAPSAEKEEQKDARGDGERLSEGQDLPRNTSTS